jgi:uncharacterized protein
MAQANSVQREPSMEEILASIRRIIEDSDGGRKGVEGTAVGEVQPAAPAARAEVDTFRVELGAGVDRRPQPAAPELQIPAVRPEPAEVTELARPFRLAEVQAQVVREAAAPAKPPQAERKPLTLADIQQQISKDTAQHAAPAAPRPAAEARPQPAQPQPAQPQPPTTAAAETPVVERREPRASLPPAMSWKADEAAPKPVAIGAPASAAAAAADPTRQPIISQVAGRQVAAAFGELSEAFAVRSKKTFDEMAEQMLRPMLQEWLDNNLPLLVEKLVREEIERVARGA